MHSVTQRQRCSGQRGRTRIARPTSAGFERGLVIYRVGRYDVNSVKQVESLLARARAASSVDFAVGLSRAADADSESRRLL